MSSLVTDLFFGEKEIEREKELYLTLFLFNYYWCSLIITGDPVLSYSFSRDIEPLNLDQKIKISQDLKISLLPFLDIDFILTHY